MDHRYGASLAFANVNSVSVPIVGYGTPGPCLPAVQKLGSAVPEGAAKPDLPLSW
jgi:hypothetical protein